VPPVQANDQPTPRDGDLSGAHPAPSVAVATWKPWASLLVAPVVIGSVSAMAPHVELGPFAVDLLTFAGACITSLGAITLLSRAPLEGKARIATSLAAAATLAIIALLHARSALAVVAVATALVALAHTVGDFIGSHIEHPGHILPACVVASCIDITSALHPSGPTHAVIASPKALAMLAVSFPVIGTSQHAPVIGIGDLLFVSLLLGTARTHGIRWWKVALAALVGVALAGAASATLQEVAPDLPGAVPALPAIGAATVLGVRPMRILRPKDRRVAWIFMVGAVLFAAVTLASRFLLASRV
jgi:hypothetical protein